MWFIVDHRSRIEFYVRRGLVKRAPTEAQLSAAAKLNRYGAGVVERLQHYVRHPLDMLPTRSKLESLERADQERQAASRNTATLEPREAAPAGANDAAARLPAFDRFLRSAFQVSPIRFAVQCWYNPWTPIPSTGLNLPSRYIISHVVHSPHPTALWDVQIIHPDPGALDALEREVEMASRTNRTKARIYRALTQRPEYYDYLRDLIRRVRRFEYPPTPEGFNPVLENLVLFLNFAADLDPNPIAARG